MINYEALYKISYGIYIVSSGDSKTGNGYVSNTVFQITAEPPRFAASCNKNNLTAEFIKKYGAYSVSILEQNASSEIMGKFGYKSGKDFDKMAGTSLKYGETGVPIVLDETIAYFECKLVDTIDVGTHLLFIGELVSAERIDESKEALTYLHYRQTKKGFSPKNAPTYIDKSKLEKSNPKNKPVVSGLKQYKCAACGYIYDEENETVLFKDLPETWVCPVCGSEKADFIEV